MTAGLQQPCQCILGTLPGSLLRTVPVLGGEKGRGEAPHRTLFAVGGYTSTRAAFRRSRPLHRVGKSSSDAAEGVTRVNEMAQRATRVDETPERAPRAHETAQGRTDGSSQRKGGQGKEFLLYSIQPDINPRKGTPSVHSPGTISKVVAIAQSANSDVKPSSKATHEPTRAKAAYLGQMVCMTYSHLI